MLMMVEVLVVPEIEIDEDEEYTESDEVDAYSMEIDIDPWRIESIEPDLEYGDYALVTMHSSLQWLVMKSRAELRKMVDESKQEDMWTKFFKSKGN